MQYFSLNGSDWRMKEFLGEDWVWRNAHKGQTGDIRWWKPGTVPGSVLHDLYQHGEVPDPYFGRNSLLVEWVPERTWVYRKSFLLPEDMEGKDILLCFRGVDYEALIYLNDVFLGEHRGMFTPFSFDVTKVLKPGEENLLAVVIQKAPEEQPQVSKTRYVKTHKSRMTYWWDFCPRMIHQGIWDDVYLEAYSGIRVGEITVDTCLFCDCKRAELEVTAVIEGAGIEGDSTGLVNDVEILVRLTGKGEIIKEQRRKVKVCHGSRKIHMLFEVEDPELWWPNEYGSQHMYEIEAEAYGKGEGGEPVLLSAKHTAVGIREIQFLKNEGSEPGARPYTLQVNGRKIYMKGWNWVPMDVMYGVKAPEKLAHLIRLAKEAHVNFLRVWGGGLIEREEFYRLCDENGILVWQEFIQSSSGIEDKPSEERDFLAMMEKEAESIIPGRKNHLSLALWGGGNELRSEGNNLRCNKDEIIRDEEPVIRVLGSQVHELDRTRYFLPSSPTGRVFNNTLENIEQDPRGLHDVHGPWEHQGLIGQYELYNRGTALLSSEFGVEGMTNLGTLKRSMPEEFLWPPSRDNFYYFHRGSWWNNYPLMQKVFGDGIGAIEEAVAASQFMQYEGLKYAVELNRRRAMISSGTFPWQFNEPYPNNTCTSSVDYYGLPKPAYYGVKKAYAETVVFAEFDGQTLADKEDFHASFYFQSSGASLKARINAGICDSLGTVVEYVETEGESGEEKACPAGEITCRVGDIGTELFFLLLEAVPEDGRTVTNRYLFTKTSLKPLLELTETVLEVRLEKGSFWIRNTGRESAVALKLEMEESGREGSRYLYFDDNYFSLLPEEEKRVKVEASSLYAGEADHPEDVFCRISGFNIKDTIIPILI